MKHELNIESSIKAFIVKVLSFDPSVTPVFGRTEKEDLFFKDLLTVGCDYYELLEVFANNDAINKNSVICIIDNLPDSELIVECSDKELRKMIAHWSPSKYHSASIDELIDELKEIINNDSIGTYIYNSNLNTKNNRIYNDTYILLITEEGKYFFDINRKKAYHLYNSKEGEKND